MNNIGICLGDNDVNKAFITTLLYRIITTKNISSDASEHCQIICYGITNMNLPQTALTSRDMDAAAWCFPLSFLRGWGNICLQHFKYSTLFILFSFWTKTHSNIWRSLKNGKKNNMHSVLCQMTVVAGSFHQQKFSLQNICRHQRNENAQSGM